MKQKATVVALSEKLRNDSIVGVETLMVENPKTKSFAKALKSLKLNGKVLMAFSEKEKEMPLFSRNIAKVENVMVKDLNVYDILNNKYLVLSKDSIGYLEKKFK